MPSIFRKNWWFSDSVRSVMAEAWQYIYSGQLLILFLLAQMAPIFFEVWMEARKNPFSGEFFFRRKNRKPPWGGFPSSPRQAGIVQSTVRLVKQLLTLSPVMFIFQAKVSTLGFLWRWKKLKNERNWRGGLSTGGRFKAPKMFIFPSLHNSSLNLNQWMKGTDVFFNFFNMFPSFLWCVDSIWEYQISQVFGPSPKPQSHPCWRSLASIPWTSWNLVAPLTPDGLRYPDIPKTVQHWSCWWETHLKERHRS